MFSKWQNKNKPARVKTLLAYIGIYFLLIKQIPRGRNVFCEVWLNLIIPFQSGILPPNSGEEKVFATFWFYLSQEFRISCCQVCITCKKSRGPDLFRPLLCQIQGGAPPPKSTPIYAYAYFFKLMCKYACSVIVAYKLNNKK